MNTKVTKRSKKLPLLAIVIMGCQFLLWNGVSVGEGDNKKTYWLGTRHVKPELEIVPAVPSKEILKALSFGDEELAFRYNGYMMQFIGDTFGRVTPLKDYDFPKLQRWWNLLDEINSTSNMLPYVVAYYYGSTQNQKEQIPYVVDFLVSHSDKHPSEKWWWYGQAAYNAKFKMKDTKRALEIAKKLADLPKDLDIPIWTRQLQAFLYEDEGEYKQACNIIVNVLSDYGEDKLTQGEMNFIYNFLQERLRAMIEKESSIAKADISPECRALMDIQKASDLKEKSKLFNLKQ